MVTTNLRAVDMQFLDSPVEDIHGLKLETFCLRFVVEVCTVYLRGSVDLKTLTKFR